MFGSQNICDGRYDLVMMWLLDFSEAMRVLGFPQPISLESFRVPNWELMEQCVRWLVERVEGDADLGRAGADHRVALVTRAIALFVSNRSYTLEIGRLRA